MPRIIDDLKGIELVGDGADAVLIGGADESYATNQVFSYMNLARAFAELEAGADLYCLHRNRWWQTARGPLLDTGAFVAGLEYAAEIEATLLGKPSPAFFQAALDALDADAERTWMVGDDLEADIAGAQTCGLKRSSCARGSSARRRLDARPSSPTASSTRSPTLPGWIETAA